MRNALIAYLITTSTLAAAQAWCAPQATWVYDTGNPSFASQTRITYVSDTVVDGFQAQRLDRTTQLVQQGGLFTASIAGLVTRTNGDVVWEWNDNAWDTLYWFSAQPGDHWQPFWHYGEQCADHAWHVISIGTTTEWGIPLRTVTAELRAFGESLGWEPFTFTERIGGGGGHIFPGLPPCGAIIECYCSFSCYRDTDIETGPFCELTLEVSAPSAGASPLLAPNPTMGITRVDWPGKGSFAVRAFDRHGRLVGEWGPVGAGTSVDMSGLSPGLYELVFLAPDHEQTRTRLLVH
jgi:hypothetical protein